MSSSISVDFLKEIITKTKTIQAETAVFMVANTKNETASVNDYLSHSIITEYFSENELEEIATGFRDNHFYTDISTDEDVFIKKVQAGFLSKIPQKNKIVYNAAQKGTGPGRKSLIPAFCNMHGIPISGSNAYVSSLCRHKYHYSSILQQHELQQMKCWLYYYKSGWLLGSKPPDGQKVIVKPIYESASIGVDDASILITGNHSAKAIQAVSETFEQPVIVQEFISGFEVEVPLFSDSCETYTLGCVGISLSGKKFLGDSILTYQSVYDDEYSFYDFNEQMDNKTTSKILQAAKDSMEVLGIEGMGRVDFRVTKEGEYFITDVATNPHITRHSSFAFLFKQNGFGYTDLPVCMLSLAARKYGWI